MTTTEKELVRRCWEECFAGNLAIADDLVAADFRWHGPGQEVTSREGIKQLIAAFRAGQPDIAWRAEDQLAEGDKVATRLTVRGTHTGTLLGIPPTQQPVTITGIVISRIADGQIAEEWESFDQLGLLQQLGVAPTPAPAPR